MASSAIQLLGFLLSLVGVAATVAATFMVEWKKQMEGEHHRLYEGLWMLCSGTEERTTCEYHESLLEVPTEFQVTRSMMLLSLLLAGLAVMISTVGMKCTRFMEGKAKSKSITAMIGGILFILSGLVSISVTSWYVQNIVHHLHHAHHLHRFEFGRAVFVSWGGGLLTASGGLFLTCRKCSRSDRSESNNAGHFLSAHSKSNYV